MKIEKSLHDDRVKVSLYVFQMKAKEAIYSNDNYYENERRSAFAS